MEAFLAAVPPRSRGLPRLSRKDFPSPRFSSLCGFWTLPSGRYQVRTCSGLFRFASSIVRKLGA
eukprot:677924-Pyramimonas_sp.AAC.1